MPKSAGIDWARLVDYTTSIVVDYSNPALWIVTDYLRIRRQNWNHIISAVESRVQGCSPILGDATGKGDSLCEMVTNCIGIVSTGIGQTKAMPFDRLSVSKSELIKPMLKRVNNRSIAVGVEAPELQIQLVRFCMRFTGKGHAKYEAKTGHDDDVLALVLACYGAENTRSLGNGQKSKDGRRHDTARQWAGRT